MLVTSRLVTATVKVVVIMLYLFLSPRLSFLRQSWGLLLSFFCSCFFKKYAETSRTTAFAISFKSSNKNSMLYHPLSFQMERRDNNRPTFTRYTVILLFYHVSTHLNSKPSLFYESLQLFYS